MKPEVSLDTPAEQLLEAVFHRAPGSEPRENALLILKARSGAALIDATRNLGYATWALVAATVLMAVAVVIQVVVALRGS